MSSIFETLNNINVNEHTEKKNNLTYLSWAWAWAEIKKAYPEATYTIYEAENGCFYHTDGKTCWVKTGVTINDLEHIEYLPVMDYKNKSISVDAVTSTDVNRAIQRSLTKACARHGLGLYIYAGEDLPEAEIPEDMKNTRPSPTKAQQQEDAEKADTINDNFDLDKVKPATDEQIKKLREACFATGLEEAKMLKMCNADKWEDVKAKAADEALKWINTRANAV